MQEKATIGVVGLWHLGCVLSAAWSKLGFKVIGFDYSKELIENLDKNQPPIFEPRLEQTLADSREKNKLSFTNDMSCMAECDFAFLAYDTPVLDNDESDLVSLQKAIDDFGNCLRDNAIVIVSSQTPVGTCSKFRKLLKAQNRTLELVCSPENLRLGEAIDCYINPGRIILGAESEEALSKTVGLFSVIDAELVKMNLASAEMVKHAINSFLANSIVFANNLADLCETVGANIFDVVKGTKSDPRIGQKAYLTPGIGFSGGTLGRDLLVLAKLNQASSLKAFLFDTIHKLNSERKNIIIDKIIAILGGDLSLNNVAVLGLTYKPGTSTLRRSLPLEIVNALIEERANVKVYDPKANYSELEQKPAFEIANSIDDAISQSDLILLLTEWNNFKEYDWEKAASLLRDKKIFDTKNFLYDLKLNKKGYQYFGIGIPDG
jgi:UDPglucose 6-dehydrogenase